MTSLHLLPCDECYLWSPGELSEGVGVGDEGETRATTHHGLDVCVEIMCKTAENSKDGYAGEQRSEGVCEADNPGIPSARHDMKGEGKYTV